MPSPIEELNHRIAATGEEWAEDFSDAQEEFNDWAKKESIPHSLVKRTNKALREKAVEVFNEAYNHCKKLLQQEVTEDQADKLNAFMESELGLLLARIYEIRERAFKPYHVYFRSVIPDIISAEADKWLEDNS